MEKRKKRKVTQKIIFLLFAVLVLALIFVIGLLYPRAGDPSGEWHTDAWKEKELKLHFLDVGQGDCTLIELPDGRKMMIDGGDGSAENKRKVLNYLNALGIEKLDYLLLTHGDADHYGGLESVLDEIRVEHAYLPYEATLVSDAAYLSLHRAVLKKVPAVEYSERYMNIRGENYFLMFLWPHSVGSGSGVDRLTSNESSAVVWLDYLGTSVLFCGDISSGMETNLLNDYRLDSEIFNLNGMKVELESTEILKVAHHGSAYSSSLEWLELLNFQTAVISCGAGNAYGHPAAETLKNLKKANPSAAIYRTDECGDVIITLSEGEPYTVSYENQLAALSAFESADELFGLAYIDIKLLHTEKFILC